MDRGAAIELYSAFRPARRRSIMRDAAAVRRYVTMAEDAQLGPGQVSSAEALGADIAPRAWMSHDRPREEHVCQWRRNSLKYARRTLAWAVLAPLLTLPGCGDSTAPVPCTAQVSGRCWTYLGPAGKWITAVALSPDGVLVGTKSDGVFRYDPSEGSWVSLGLAGRFITSITALPPPTNRLLVTATPTVTPWPPDTISAVVYASDDGGRTWYPHDGGLSAQRGYYGYAFSLAFDSSDPNRLYLGLPAAVMRSVDGGATWTTAVGNPQAPGGLVWCLAVSPRDSGRVWAGGESTGQGPLVLRSDDRGNSWNQLTPSPYQEDVVFAIAPDPLARDRLYAGMASGLRVTEDAGVAWRLVLSPRLPGPVTGLAMAGGNLIAVADELVPDSVPLTTVLGLYTTSDRGVTWDTLPVPPNATGAISVAVSAGRIAFIGTKSGLWSVPLP